MGAEDAYHAVTPLQRIALGIAPTEFQADAGAGCIGPEFTVLRSDGTVEKHLLDAHVVEEVLDVPELLARHRSVQM